MLDYRGIEALFTVQELQSFEAAAKKLHITQSAVSQRIKGLETFYGEPLLIRTHPYQLTPLGQQLIRHYQKISLLEDDLQRELGAMPKSRMAIALNRDSIETWFIELIREKGLFSEVLLEIVADDQEKTLEYLKNGRVSACLSTNDKPIVGGECVFVGNMEYLMVGSPSFVKEHRDLKEATFLKFDHNDKLQDLYLEKFFGIKASDWNYYVIPSVRGFKEFALAGYACGLIPRIDIEEELKRGLLVELFPSKRWIIPLYWHYYALHSQLTQKFNAEMIRLISNSFKKSSS